MGKGSSSASGTSGASGASGADVRLVFGAAASSESQIKSDLVNIIKNINANPPKVKMGVELSQAAVKAATKQLSKSTTDALQSDLSWEKVTNKYYKFQEQYGEIFSRNKQYATEYLAIGDKIQRQSFSGGIKEANVELIKMQNQAYKTGLTTESLGQKISRVFKEKFGYGVMAVLALAARQAFSEIYQNVVKVDTAMTELKKVTDETSDTYNKFLEGATTRAKSLGAALDDVVNATAD